ncbi:hypothetical protein KY308_03420 [Candidatus Woesearchaeota archaeon]|nr:hypothetical protein [Candidatus Woesearchaeota archaeon]
MADIVQRHFYFRKMLDYIITLAEDSTHQNNDFDIWEYNPSNYVDAKESEFSLEGDVIVTRSNLEKYVFRFAREFSKDDFENALKDMQYHGILISSLVSPHAKPRDIEYRVNPEHLQKQIISVGEQRHSSLFVNGGLDSEKRKESLKDEINNRLKKKYGDDEIAKSILEFLLRWSFGSFPISYIYYSIRNQMPNIHEVVRKTERLLEDDILVKRSHSAIGDIYQITRVVYPFEKIRELVAAKPSEPIVQLYN